MVLKRISPSQMCPSSQSDQDRTTIDCTVSCHKSYVCFTFIFQTNNASDFQSIKFFFNQCILWGKESQPCTHCVVLSEY